jgi:hypothetical protein
MISRALLPGACKRICKPEPKPAPRTGRLDGVFVALVSAPVARKVARQQQARRPLVSKHSAHRAKCQCCAVPPQAPGAAGSAGSSQQLAGAVPLSLGANGIRPSDMPSVSRSDDQPLTASL